MRGRTRGGRGGARALLASLGLVWLAGCGAPFLPNVRHVDPVATIDGRPIEVGFFTRHTRGRYALIHRAGESWQLDSVSDSEPPVPAGHELLFAVDAAGGPVKITPAYNLPSVPIDQSTMLFDCGARYAGPVEPVPTGAASPGSYGPCGSSLTQKSIAPNEFGVDRDEIARAVRQTGLLAALARPAAPPPPAPPPPPLPERLEGGSAAVGSSRLAVDAPTRSPVPDADAAAPKPPDGRPRSIGEVFDPIFAEMRTWATRAGGKDRPILMEAVRLGYLTTEDYRGVSPSFLNKVCRAWTREATVWSQHDGIVTTTNENLLTGEKSYSWEEPDTVSTPAQDAYSTPGGEALFGHPAVASDTMRCLLLYAALVDRAVHRLTEVGTLSTDSLTGLRTISLAEMERSARRAFWGAMGDEQTGRAAGAAVDALSLEHIACTVPTPNGLHHGRSDVLCGEYRYDQAARVLYKGGFPWLSKEAIGGTRIALVEGSAAELVGAKPNHAKGTKGDAKKSASGR